MVNKVNSRYNASPPADALRDNEERVIGHNALYPDMLDKLDSCSVHPATKRTLDMMQAHLIDLGNLRTWVELALREGIYENSQWCRGNAPDGVYACDAYVVHGMLYKPAERQEVMCKMYVKVCITKSNQTVAVLSLHPANY